MAFGSVSERLQIVLGSIYTERNTGTLKLAKIAPNASKRDENTSYTHNKER